MTVTIQDTVKAAVRAGLCVVPPREDGSKMPLAAWKQWQSERPSRAQINDWYAGGDRSGVGLVCGAISLNLELQEFEDEPTYQLYKDNAEALGLGPLVERIETGYLERSPGGGYHWLYRCVTAVEGNTILARNMDGTVRIETRGEGGYVVVAPSHGSVHPSGEAYELLRGSLDRVVTITANDRAALHRLAEALDEQPKQEYAPSAPYVAATSGHGESPGDAYDRQASWDAILRPHGWEYVARHGQVQYWKRPGSDNRWSATINGAGVGPNRLYVFSSNAVPLESRRSYRPFQAYAVLEHGGDFKAAAGALREAGYGTSTRVRRLTSGTHPVSKNGATEPSGAESNPDSPVDFDDFYAYMPEHKYIFIPTRELWPAPSVNNRLPALPTGRTKKDGDPEYKPASYWLDRDRPVEQMTWAPGFGLVVEDQLLADGRWVQRPGCTTFNLYRAPTIERGDADRAALWIEHVYRLYPDEAEHIIAWLAHRVQRPGEKINHALVLGGQQGIGKDSLIEPVRMAVGPWNVSEVSPGMMLGRFNGYIKSVILRVSEARDLGENEYGKGNRYTFYEHMKTYTAAPPVVLRCDEKNAREYSVLNVCGVIITTNHKTDGMYLPADDRRHFVAWSDLSISDFDAEYWTRLYTWFDTGGYQHIAAFLATYDLSDFNPKAPPPKTAAFWAIVDANRPSEDAELADALDSLNRPAAITMEGIAHRGDDGFRDWALDRKNRRQIPHRMEAVGYVPIRNDAASDGLWKIGSKRRVVYARRELTPSERSDAARELTGR